MNAGARHALSIEEIANKLLKVSIDTGLAPDQIKLRQEKFGPHKITERKEVGRATVHSTV